MRVKFSKNAYKKKVDKINQGFHVLKLDVNKDIFCLQLMSNGRSLNLYTKDHNTYVEWYDT